MCVSRRWQYFRRYAGKSRQTRVIRFLSINPEIELIIQRALTRPESIECIVDEPPRPMIAGTVAHNRNHRLFSVPITETDLKVLYRGSDFSVWVKKSVYYYFIFYDFFFFCLIVVLNRFIFAYHPYSLKIFTYHLTFFFVY